MKSRHKGILILLGSGISFQGIEFALKNVIAVVLGPYLFGLLSLLQMIPMYAEKMLRFGIDQAAAYVAGQDRNKERNVFFNATFLNLLLAAFAISVMLSLRDPFWQKHIFRGDIIPNSLFLLATLMIIPVFVNRVFSNQFLYAGRLRLFSLMNYGTAIAANLSLLIAAVLFDNKISLFYPVFVATWFLTMVAIAYQGIQFFQSAPRMSGEIQKRLVSFGFRLYFPTVIQFLHQRADMILVAFFLSPREVGLYNLASVIAQAPFILAASLSGLVYTQCSKISDPAQSRRYVIEMLAHFLTLIPTFAFFWLFVEWVVQLWLKEYIPMLPSFRILLPAWTLLGIASILTQNLYSQGNPEFPTGVTGVSAGLNILANIYLIPRFGIVGAAWTSLITYGFVTTVLVIHYLKKTGLRWGEMWESVTESFRMYRGFIS